MRSFILTLTLCGLFLTPLTAFAQGTGCAAAASDAGKTFEQQVANAKSCVIDSVKASYDTETSTGNTHAEAAGVALSFGGGSQEIARYLQLIRLKNADQYRFLLDVQESRSDLQVGSSSGSKTATTSIVTKGVAPAVLGFAVEHGALDREVNGNSVTFRGNPTGLIQTFAGLGFQAAHDQVQGDLGLELLNRASFAITFDTSTGNQPGVLLANKQQVAAWSLRYQIINHRDPRDGRYRKLWDEFLAKSTLGISGQRLFRALQQDVQLKAWNTALIAKATAAPAGQFRQIAVDGFKELENIAVSTEVTTALTEYMDAIAKTLEGRKEIREYALKGSVATIDYSVSRDPNLPDLSDIRFVAATSAAGRVDLTFNAGVSFFNKKTPQITSQIKAYEVSGQIDTLVGSSPKIGGMTLSLAYRFQKLPQDTKVPGFVGTVKKGVINTGQLKLTIPVKGSGVKIPISFTAANRSELITEKKFLSANVGMTFDFDSILAKLTP